MVALPQVGSYQQTYFRQPSSKFTFFEKVNLFICFFFIRVAKGMMELSKVSHISAKTLKGCQVLKNHSGICSLNFGGIFLLITRKLVDIFLDQG